MNEARRTAFLAKFAEDLHNDDEHEEFVAWVKSAHSAEISSAMDMYMKIADAKSSEIIPDPLFVARLEAELDALDKLNVRDSHTVTIWYKLAAATILLVLSAGLYFYSDWSQPQIPLVQKQGLKIHDALPGSNIAVLTLADGSRISLDDAANGSLAVQAGVQVSKAADGQLVYKISSQTTGPAAKNLFNTISTPRGGQYQVDLPDGSRVWLNAASSLTYPLTFGNNERKVELTGEAYFEIAHNKSKPFRVLSSDQVVEVFGTEFNINSYANEPVIKTTLLTGSVKVSQAQTGNFKFLKPGQQSTNNRSTALLVGTGDITQAVSWKNGNFIFNDMDLINIMRQLERWYDVDVDYSRMPQTRYNGNISRQVNLSKVLKMLEITGPVKFKVDGKAIKVSK